MKKKSKKPASNRRQSVFSAEEVKDAIELLYDADVSQLAETERSRLWNAVGAYMARARKLVGEELKEAKERKDDEVHAGAGSDRSGRKRATEEGRSSGESGVGQRRKRGAAKERTLAGR
jgi:hypothetical protein